MAGPLFSWVNYADDATFTADSQASTLPASNLSDPIFQKVWRTSGATTAQVIVDFGSSKQVGLVILGGTNISSTDTVRIGLSDTSGNRDLLDTTATATGLVTGYNLYAYILGSKVTARYLTIDIVATSRTAQGNFQVGRLWASDTFQPGVGIAFGFQDAWIDSSSISVGPRSGVEFIDETFQKRVINFELRFLTETESQDNVKEMQRVAGIRNQIAIVPNPGTSRLQQEALIGRMTQSTPILHPSFNIFSKTFQVRESL